MKMRLEGRLDRDTREAVEDLKRHLMMPEPGEATKAVAAIPGGEAALSAVQMAARGQRFLQLRALQLYKICDLVSSGPTWMGAYIKNTTPEAKGGLGMAHEDACYAADKAVRNAHGGQGVKDLADVQRGGELWKALTLFYGFWNHNLNRSITTAHLAASEDIPWKEKAGTVAMRALAYVWGVQGIHQMFASIRHKDNESWWQHAAEAPINAAAFGVPLVRNAVEALEHKYRGRFDFEDSPITGDVNALFNAAGEAMNGALGKHVTNRAVEHITQGACWGVGFPGGQQIGATAQFLADEARGRQNAEDFGQWMRGLTTGHARQDSQ
jgi:hypothetical protein